MIYTTEHLESCLKKARSYESRDAYGAAGVTTVLIGTVMDGKYVRDIYKDTDGNYWYKTRVQTAKGIVSEYEAIFGHPEKTKKDARSITRRTISARRIKKA